MAIQGKKINELESIVEVSDDTVFPAVYVQDSTTSSTANKVSISQLKDNLGQDFPTKIEVESALSNKQDKLIAGPNITISSNTVSSPNSVQSLQVTNIIYCTQAEYDALVDSGTVDANTLYLIIEGSN